MRNSILSFHDIEIQGRCWIDGKYCVGHHDDRWERKGVEKDRNGGTDDEKGMKRGQQGTRERGEPDGRNGAKSEDRQLKLTKS